MSHASFISKGLNQAFKSPKYGIWVVSLSKHLTAAVFFYGSTRKKHDLLLTLKQIHENLWTHPPQLLVSHTMAEPLPHTIANQSQFISAFF